jgi:hypothetical protein
MKPRNPKGHGGGTKTTMRRRVRLGKNQREPEFCPANAVKSKVRFNAPMSGVQSPRMKESGCGTIKQHNIMNAELNKKLMRFAKEHQWQDLLRSLPPGEGVPLVLDSIQSLDNLRSVASRLNTKGQEEDKCRYTFSGLNYETKAICAYATPKENVKS